ncbi:TetR/AcrR family transcriptional regulator [Streptomyces griseorubiginosus]|uniref:TetR family transcriptional regulator n=1 Tax=Streptomyces griseorubiginosus TaxID=67304 RepID=A0A117PL64_9ACTN|nr:TetR/AcrR family transcriptional regulator [Streptomyces griseorubiginosus]KUM81688.1 TetR family transcriptional regulator [Streptomyces griseorubiginosus]KUN65252.1 TetR family transcriptional regulator [Streptomyces griseorubiginosus]
MEARTESVRRPGRPGAGTPAVPGEESILQRGLEAFAELGYDRASARELARRLGVSHNFINDRYGSKAAFWRAVMDHALGPRPEDLPERDPAVDDADLLRQTIAGFYRAAADTPLIGRILVDESSRDTERLDYLYERHIVPTLQLMAPSIERLIASGRMAPVPMDVLFFAVVPPVAGMIDGPLARRLGRPEPASPRQLADTAEALATLVVNGLLATGGQKGR